MTGMDDWELIEEFRTQRSETAFSTLVNRYLGLVYSSALRQVRQQQLAEDVAQAVFVLLARKAGSFEKDIILPGWLFRTTRFIASRANRTESRRKLREQEALQMQELSAPDETWRAIAPILDEALDHLGETDRNAVLLRFIDEKNLRETGAALGVSEEAAKKRVARALEKLRVFFQRRGFAISSLALIGALSQNFILAAPAGLAARITPTASSTLAGPLTPWTPLKIAAGLVGLGIVLSFVTVQPWRNRVTPNTPSSPGTVAANQRPRLVAPRPANVSSLKMHVVSTETGQGIPGAKVFAQFWHDFQVRELVSDAEGNCEVSLPGVEFGRLDLGALAEWHVQRHVVFRKDTVWPVPAEFTLKLERAVSAGGWVRDESGRAVSDANIFFDFPGLGDDSEREPKFERLGFAERIALTKTDASGRWSCAILPTNYGQFTIRVEHPAFLAQSFATDKDDSHGVPMTNLWAGNALFVLKDKPPLSLSGRVTDAQGMPITGARVEMKSWPAAPVLTDATGYFQLTRLRAGTNGITVSASGFAPERVFVNVTRDVAPVTIQLKPGTLLRLCVVDENEAAVPDAMVALSNWRDRNDYDWRANTDGRGCVEWADAPAEPMKFDVIKTGYFRSDDQPVQADGQEHTIVLRQSLKVSGQVIDAETGQRLAKFKVIPGYQEPDSRQWFRSDLKNCSNGYYDFSFEEWRPPFTVRIEADGYEVAMSRVLAANPREQVYDFALTRLDEKFVVRGTVFLPDGRPAIGAEVALGSLDHSIRLGHKRFQRQTDTLATNANERGEFVFGADPNAHTVVVAAPEGFAKVRIRAGEPLRIMLQPWGRIEGTVRVPNPEVRSWSVHLSHPGSGNYRGSLWLYEYQGKVDAAGNFAIEDVPPGEFSCLLYNHRGIPGHSVGVDIQAGTTTHVEIGGNGSTVTGRLKPASTNAIDWLNPTLARLEAQVTGGPRFGTSDDVITLRRKAEFWMSREGMNWSLANRMYPIEVDATGGFRVDDVPAGAYRFVAVFSNRSVITNVTIPEEPTIDLGDLVVR